MTSDLLLPTLQDGRILRLYHYYRIIVGLIFFLLTTTNLDANLLNVNENGHFFHVSWAYLGCNVLAAFLPPLRKQNHVFLLALFDVLLLSYLMYCAGGTSSGIGNLVIITVSIANILLRGRIGILLAALATLVLIYATFYRTLLFPNGSTQYVQAGGLGALCFAAAFLVQSLVGRLMKSQTLAEERATVVADLETLNALILDRMRTGIIVLNASHKVLLANPASLELLGQTELVHEDIESHCPELMERLQQWDRNRTLRPTPIQAFGEGPLIQPSFVPIQRSGEQHLLIFLENISRIAQQAQQLKLVSLGRLTAGIAHEIRNPLGAISHAAQLLQESDTLDKSDQRLTQIIQDQSRRMNIIIENVLQLSRRRQAEPQLLDLKYWVHRFAGELRPSLRADQFIHIQTTPGTLQTRMDPSQLTQVMTNLVQNGLRHSAKVHGKGQVWLDLFRDPESDLPVLDITDDGPGVPEEQIQNLFEPFFTTESKGTGLGLYISRELCESNQALLDYRPQKQGGCFRITFAHPRKLS
ncbi:two-component system sensor histidine kinase PilS (NtrC family) [Pseudomonas duriflava]|uniref:histidine kinase n=1 Tax=Pseudomonas duriflava TaxID=459528 RepID=A0A562QE70_9PSED|nr:ATP-binding protein [Pseudomonas duriflava]TWI54336.1 two-component system sensor histidine kinase PilS (NtrC family) [Pseudomonas duriflava]